MADFLRALPYVLAHEGGWSDDPDDPGGATMRGITLATARRHGIFTKTSLREITPEKLAEIYQADYWRFNGIISQRVATKLLDMAVNFGLETAVKMAQEALNDLAGDILREDGHWGSKTEQCLNTVLAPQMLQLLCHEAAGRYLDIVRARPASKKFLNGWMKRASEVPDGSIPGGSL
jgi:type VI secretion system secreted protein VgrG